MKRRLIFVGDKIKRCNWFVLIIFSLSLISSIASGLVVNPVCTENGTQEFPAVSGDIIVWADYRNEATTGIDIYMWDPVNGEQPVCTDIGHQMAPEISGNNIIWYEEPGQIYKWDPVNGKELVCTGITFDPNAQGQISGDSIVYLKGDDVYMWDPVNGEQPVCVDPALQQSPAISGNTVAWTDTRNFDLTGADVYMWDPVNGEQPVCIEIGHQSMPVISGDTIVYAYYNDQGSTGMDLYMWDPINGEQPVCTAIGNQWFQGISGDTIVWMDNRNEATTGGDIYMAVPGDAPPITEEDNYTLNQDTVLSIPTPGVLENDNDPEGDTLTALVVSNPINGDVSLNSDGSFTYTPLPGWYGNVTFTYKANDGLADSNIAEVWINIIKTPEPTEYVINATSGEGGTISPSGDTTITAGGTQVFNILTDKKYKPASITIDNITIDLQNLVVTFNNVLSDHTIHAEFAAPGKPSK